MKATVRTLSEIKATATKAARGAGCPWGLAEEAGLAARLLESHGLPGVATLGALFGTQRDCTCDGRGELSCGLLEMATLSDTLSGGNSVIGPVTAPLLLAGPCLLDARSGGSWRIHWENAEVRCGPNGVVAKGSLSASKAEVVTIARDAPPTAARAADWRSRELPRNAWMDLEALAARTLVPETLMSRATGAGPGRSEND
ncbi:MAG: DUF3726 domain-containing protein [Pseudomonadota bacterium]